ncbi:Zn(II)2Cys6 transcription factor [Aspergillus saccharolyticus JOP 1030-1]|uniref:Zn(II)2Cys6 transcription factor n=1 Tax=Aspergillus saccharolyticus JOP 1030-1 TaxID=1450539 RepID=A0A318ZH46_9EURO|nr:Zn(II)2Cys6 transcription factor [Aspergillus saccharolyticus JOP 1030-1]PYH43903.1 Zn(II)2Cys6 transcription factor [Aspergillus saccharolyticus JOP 1030-1]
MLTLSPGGFPPLSGPGDTFNLHNFTITSFGIIHNANSLAGSHRVLACGTMNSQANSPSLRRAKKACTECRQQKAKCDAYMNADLPCSRCTKMKTRCIISDPFRREHKRLRLSKLEQETDELRRKLSGSHSESLQQSPIAMLTAAAEMEVVHPTPTAADSNLPPHPQTTSIVYSQQLTPHLSPSLSYSRITAVPDRLPTPTESRTLKNVHLTGSEIDELFQLFFRQYACFLPILDPQTPPDAYYTQSSFLFWAIIGVASRSYTDNPTLLMAISPSIVEMALLSVTSSAPAWHIIQGLLLVLTWPFPKEINKTDAMFPLSGMLLHIAMQNGLHIPLYSHEFAKRNIPAPSEADMARRSELWARCVVVYQRACVTKGQCPRSMVDLQQDLGQQQVVSQKIAPSLALELKCLGLIARCSAAVLEFGIRTMSAEQERSFDILLRTFESQATELEAHVNSANDRLHTTTCRLCVQMFHLFKNQTIHESDCLARVVTTACRTIDCIQEIGRAMENLASAPMQITYGLLLPASALLRILKCSTHPDVDIERGKKALFSAINMARRMSVDVYDTASKIAIVMNQLWNSSRAFRKADGTEFIALKIRSRLVLSPVIDTIWWWRDEFEPQFYHSSAAHGTVAEGVDSDFHQSSGPPNAPSGLVDRQDPVLFDEQFLADFEWALSNDGLLQATEPYGSVWPAAGTIA